MNKYHFMTLCLLLNLQMNTGQVFKGQIPAAYVPERSLHWEAELAFDVCTDEKAWKGLHGIHTAFGSTDKLYFRREVPEGNSLTGCYTSVAWKGERVNAQILVWSAEKQEQVRFLPQDLVSQDGKSISKDNISLEMVRYVLSNYPYGDKKAVCGESPYKQGFLMPDRFENFERFTLEPTTTRPVWLTIDIPGGTAPGLYTGKIEVKSTHQTAELTLQIRVQNQLLPPPGDWTYRLDLWQNPWAVAWHNHVKPWSDEHKLILKKHLELYAGAGGKYITTYGVHSPWADNSYWIEGGMIEWIKKKDGSWRYEYTILDEYVGLAMACGIKQAITIYTPIPWGNRFRYMDEETGNYVSETWEPESGVFQARWHDFLSDLKTHLENKGWFGITYLGINENTMEQTLTAIRVIKSHDKKWKITYAGNWHEELDPLLDDYSYIYGREPASQQQEKRSKRGATTTYYVCCNPPVPNNFVFSPPVEGRWISWYALAKGYDGFLRWAYDAWPEDPLRDARHGSWAAGDCFMIYPGGKSCIRFEKLREGITDYEKMKILMEKAGHSQQTNVKDLIRKLNEQLKVFAAETGFDEDKIAADIQYANSLIENLSDLITD
ncbi:MAG: DUF4091 domain-containing protein [Tannerellaceae bacterium]|nr:DUF4091 domain-containing protein [Tannerellaceae bacterium]